MSPTERLACPRATGFAEVADDGLRHGGTRMDETDTSHWIVSGLSASLYQTTMPDVILGLLRTLDEIQLGYPVSMLQHSLQTATRAREVDADDDLVLAALLHHVGMTVTVEGYAEVSASIVRGHVSEDAYRIIRHQPEYAARHYGGHTSEATDLRVRHSAQSFHAAAVRLADEWERHAYDPDYLGLPLEAFEPLVRQRFTSLPDVLYATQHDCI